MEVRIGPGGCMDLEERIFRTVRIADERGYNISLSRLSRQLIGGSEDPSDIEITVRASPRLVMKNGYIGIKGRLRPDECVQRTSDDRMLRERYERIASDFIDELSNDLPGIRMIAVGGSIASNGLCRGEDIDLDIVVQDGLKYSTYLYTLYLGLLYSFRHRDLSGDRYLGVLPKLICVNVVWEESQVAPFSRKDEQMAYEIFNSEVLYGKEFYDRMIGSNHWISEMFPQLKGNGEGIVIERGGRPKAAIKERLSRFAVFSLYRLIRLSRSFDKVKRARMDRSEKVKSPYGIFDVPFKEDG